AGLPARHRELFVNACVEGESRRPFRLAEEPLVRLLVLRAGPDDHVLSVVCHHAVVDGWSQAIFASELEAAYAATRTGVAPSLPPLPVRAVDAGAWQRATLTGARREALIAYWRRTLDGCDELALPLDRERPPIERHEGDAVALRIDPE